jgi:TatD DNase family protein
MIFTDSHAHLSSVAEGLGAGPFAALLAAYAAAGEEAARAGLTPPLLLDPGTEPEDLPARMALLEPLREPSRAAFLRLAAGVWPSAENLASPSASLAALEAAIAEAERAGLRVAAIGEGGLDYHHAEGSKEAQAELFAGQLDLASRLSLPMIVHSRDAADDSLALVGRALSGDRAKAGEGAPSGPPVLIHCFGYGPAEARAFLDLGCWISFAGNLTYKKSEPLREACAVVPADRLLLETDAPYMNPMPLRGKPSGPADIGRTYALAAELRGVSVEALAETVSRNARALFSERRPGIRT